MLKLATMLMPKAEMDADMSAEGEAEPTRRRGAGRRGKEGGKGPAEERASAVKNQPTRE